MALREAGQILLAALSMPQIGENLSAVTGRGMARGGRPWSPETSHRALRDEIIGLEIGDAGARVELMRGGQLDWLGAVGQVTTFASIAYPLGQVCLGRLSAAVFYGISPVHIAAGATIAREVGAEVTDGDGGPISWDGEEPRPLVVVGWPDAHGQVLDAMQEWAP